MSTFGTAVHADREEVPSALARGRYRLGARLGTGATGVVWRARDVSLQRDVAIKQLVIPDGLAGPDVERAHADAAREGRIAASLDHPGVAAMLDMVVEHGCSWLVMEYVAGRSLADVLRDGTVSPAEAARIGVALAGALAAAHEVGVVHSDVKPANVLLGPDGVVKLADFGIARATRDGRTTGPGAVSGTPLYMAPEVARGAWPDAAADVYSLAGTVYAAVEGVAPFGPLGPNPLALVHRVADGRPNPPRRAGPLTPVLAALLVADPEQRPGVARCRELLATVAPAPVSPVDGPTGRAYRTLAPRTSAPTAVTPASVAPASVTPGASAAPASVTPASVTPASAAPASAAAPTRPPRTSRRRRVLAPLSAVGVFALGAVVGNVSGPDPLPQLRTAADVLFGPSGPPEDPRPSAAGPEATAPVATPGPVLADAPVTPPAVMPPIVVDEPAPARAASSGSDSDSDSDGAGGSGSSRASMSSDEDDASSRERSHEPSVPVVDDVGGTVDDVGGAVEDVPVVGDTAGSVLSGTTATVDDLLPLDLGARGADDDTRLVRVDGDLVKVPANLVGGLLSGGSRGSDDSDGSDRSPSTNRGGLLAGSGLAGLGLGGSSGQDRSSDDSSESSSSGSSGSPGSPGSSSGSSRATSAGGSGLLSFGDGGSRATADGDGSDGDGSDGDGSDGDGSDGDGSDGDGSNDDADDGGRSGSGARGGGGLAVLGGLTGR